MFQSSFKVVMLVALFLPIYLFSQSGPGGVGNSTTQVLWLKPDGFSVADGTVLDTWDDTSGNANSLTQPDATFRPIVKTNIVNSYDVVRFEAGNRRLRKTDFTSFPTTQVSAFYINKTTDSSDGVLSYASTSHNNNFLFFNSSNLSFYRNGNTSMNITANDGNWHMVDMSWMNSGVGMKTYFDGKLKRTFNYVPGSTITPGGSLSLAGEQDAVDANYDAAQSHQGDFSEVILFNVAINAAERVIIQNYLTAKYGLTLESTVDYYTQDNAVNGNFDFDVAGIGQADDGSNHTDSKGTGIVTINSPSALSNGDYLFWGEETKDPVYTLVSETTTYTNQLNSKWRVSKVGDLGTVSVSFDISSIASSIQCNTLQLVVDNDSNFGSPSIFNLVVSGNTATATGVSFADGDYFTLRNIDSIVWDGTTYFNGSGVLNAPNNTDSCLKLIVKSGSTAFLTEDAFVRDVEVQSGATLQVEDGILLEVEKGIVNQGTIELLGDAQLIQKHTGTSLNSGSGDLKIRQQGSYNLYNYNYWSAPVNRGGDWQVSFLETEAGPVGFTSGYDANPLASPGEISSYWLHTFNNLIDNYYGWNHISTTTPLSPTTGYIMKGSGNVSPSPFPSVDQNYVFRGTANDGDYNVSALGGNQILIGNPYPSAIDADQFITDNLSVLDGTLYFYEHFESNNSHILANYKGGYATYNLLTSIGSPAPPTNGGTTTKGAPTSNVAVAQGFFVKIANSGTITFNNNQRIFAKESAGETTFFRSAQATLADNRIKFWLKFKDNNDNESTIALGYDTNASTDFDKGYDSKMFNDLPNDLYWVISDQRLSIQGLNTFDVSDEIPLGIDISNSGNFTFEISETLNFPTNQKIYLKDNQTNTLYDIKSNPVTLNLVSGVDESRFSIVYQSSETLSTEDFITTQSLVYFDSSKNALVFKDIENLNSIKNINVFNLLGQNVKTINSIESQEVELSNINSGVYIAKITKANGQLVNLKFIKR
ncbi:T9SS type A sorting domain-containing protein [Olleya sp. UBA1516]|uniref:T9SS type A sorting domain-containing protein n=1 Tax=Olleya sp. UBA1516 TaxID=1947013 RepID=UPI0025FA9CFA|nr:T9SS type A sorting domain-containing protein [Olleya sp. UBA1516]|tara:strand:+ start:30591 stop:33557 length:2967 start_codon:yes stop_codon:yes gene_type:complete